MRILRAMSRLLAILLAAVVALLVMGAVVVPRMLGGSTLVVLTDSMAPHIKAGSVVAVKPVDPRTLRINDVVTYKTESGSMVTHRVIAIDATQAQPRFTTKGDANNVADEKPAPASAIVGREIYDIPYIGYAQNFASRTAGSPQRLTLIIVALLGGYALLQVLGAARDRHRNVRFGRAGRRELLLLTVAAPRLDDVREALRASLPDDALVGDVTRAGTADGEDHRAGARTLAVVAAPHVLDFALEQLPADVASTARRAAADPAPLGGPARRAESRTAPALEEEALDHA